MTDTRWERVKAIFQQAVDLPSAERVSLLERVCGDDDGLRREVESLLASHDAPHPLLKTTTLGAAHVLLHDDLEGHRVGPYRVVRRIAAGGMGAVYRALRADAAFEKEVAIKVVKRGMDTEEILRRFQEERQTLARLDHPNIAKLLDGGTTADGRPYLVMDYVEGTRIDDFCDAAQLSITDRLRLFQMVCRGVQHAHQNLVIHRDLKPDNILVTGDGEPKLVDFGIAKVLAASAEDSAVTRLGDRRMTLAYSSPEQVRGEPMTTASDVYSLGIILFELLTGRRLHRRVIATAVAYERALSDEASAPSSRVRETATAASDDDAEGLTPEAIAAARQTNPQGLARQLAGDLDTIVMKAIEPEPGRRYASAQQLADDIDRHLTGLPVLARPDTFRYRAAKFVRRHRASVAALVLVIIALAGGLVGTLWQARVAAGERDRAQLEARKAQQISAFLQDMLGSADPSARGRDVTVVEVLDDAAKRAEQELADQPEELALIRSTIGSTYLRLGRATQAVPLLRQALAAREARLGPSHPEVADTIHELGSALSEAGNDAEAEPLFRRALDIYRQTSGPESAATAKVLDSIASVHTSGGRLTEAVALHREVLAMRRKVLGNDHPDLAHSLNNLAVALGTLGRWEEALPLHQEAADLTKRVQGPDHRDTAAAMSTLAFVLESLGRLEEAERYYAEALAARRKILGTDHPEAAWTAYNYASLLQARGEHARALELARDVLALRGNTLPDEHPIVSATLQTRGKSLAATGRDEEAEASFRESLQIRTKALPATHWLIASGKSVLGEHLTKRRKLAEAEPLVVTGYEGLDRILGGNDRRTREALTRVIALYDAWQRPGDAQKYRKLLAPG